MKVKMKVVEHKTYPGENGTVKGYGIVFKTNYGERSSVFVPPEDEDLLEKYDIHSVHVIDVYAYKSNDGVARLGLRLERELVEEDF